MYQDCFFHQVLNEYSKTIYCSIRIRNMLL
uniref:Uncharacterized protein n=1 Tax=Lepeophtheirus salmonis TaxID=72036 RepID=A0A0K2TXI4_LEPSM